MKLQELVSRVSDKTMQVKLLDETNGILNKGNLYIIKEEQYPDYFDAEIKDINVDDDGALSIQLEYRRR